MFRVFYRQAVFSFVKPSFFVESDIKFFGLCRLFYTTFKKICGLRGTSWRNQKLLGNLEIIPRKQVGF